MKGFRTIAFNAAVVAFGVAEKFDWVSLVGPDNVGIVLAGIGFVNMLLRGMTNTPVARKD